MRGSFHCIVTAKRGRSSAHRATLFGRDILAALSIFWVFHFDSTMADGAATSGGPKTEFIQQVWTRQHGLPDNAVQAILQTRDGFLWLGTRAGLARFDGREFKVFNHLDSDAFVSDDCLALAEDRDGSLWIGTTSGLIHFAGGRFTRYTVQDGLLHDRVSRLCASRTGDLWIGTFRGVSRWQNGTLRALPRSPPTPEHDDAQILALYEDRAGAVWISDMSGLRVCGAGRDALQVAPLSIFGIPLLPNGFAEDQDGALWAYATRVARLLNGVWRVYDSGPTELENRACALITDHKGALWGGTRRGILRLQDGVVTARFTRSEGLSDDRVLSLFKDRDNNLWIGTENGLNCLRPRRIAVLTTAAMAWPTIMFAH